MTKLSKKKIKFIRNNRKRLSAKEIALRLGLKESDVRKAIRKWDEATKEDIEKERADSKGGFLQSMMNYMFYILLLFSPLIYYPRIQNFSNLPKATFIQFAICILVLVWLLKSRRSGSLEYIRHPIMIALGLWLLVCGQVRGYGALAALVYMRTLFFYYYQFLP